MRHKLKGTLPYLGIVAVLDPPFGLLLGALGIPQPVVFLCGFLLALVIVEIDWKPTP